MIIVVTWIHGDQGRDDDEDGRDGDEGEGVNDSPIGEGQAIIKVIMHYKGWW